MPAGTGVATLATCTGTFLLPTDSRYALRPLFVPPHIDASTAGPSGSRQRGECGPKQNRAGDNDNASLTIVEGGAATVQLCCCIGISPIKGAIGATDAHRPVCIADMPSHTIIPGLASAPVSSRSRRPVLLMAAALTVLAVGYCVVSQTGIVYLSSFTRLHWSYDEVDMWEGADCQHGATQVRQSDYHIYSCHDP